MKISPSVGSPVRSAIFGLFSLAIIAGTPLAHAALEVVDIPPDDSTNYDLSTLEDETLYLRNLGVTPGTQNGIISGDGTLVKQGSGTIILEGNNPFTGSVVIEAGILRIATGGVDGPAGPYTPPSITINGGGIGNAGLDQQVALGNNFTANVDFSIHSEGVNGAIEMFGNFDMGAATTRTITLTESGLSCFGGVISGQNITLATTAMAGTEVMFCSDNSNTFTGTLTIGDGILMQLDKNPDYHSVSGNLVVDSGAKVELWLGDQFATDGGGVATSDVVLNGTLDSFYIDNSVNALTGSGEIVGGGTVAVNSGSFSGTVTEDIAIHKQQSGTLTLSGANTYESGTEITGGVLIAANNQALGDGNVTIAGNATLRVNSGIALNIGAHILTLENDGQATYEKAFQNESLASFNDLTSSGGTVAEILGGSAVAPLTLTASFSTSGAVAGDVLSLTADRAEVFVLQLSYDPAEVIALFGTEANARLGWLSNGAWVLAVAGNTGGTATFKTGAWTLGDGLGTYGLNVSNHTVWAVLDHNSDFGVVGIPEPSTAWLLLLGLVSLGWLNARKSQRA